MDLSELFRPAKQSLVIIGTNPLSPNLERSAQLVADLLTLNAELTISILCESDSENFSQALMLDDATSPRRVSYSALAVHRDRILGTSATDGFYAEVYRLLESSGEHLTADRLQVRQLNLRIPANLLAIDGEIFIHTTAHTAPDIGEYRRVEDAIERERLLDLVDFYRSPSRGGIFLSKPGEELIELYDRNNVPRGIFPRSAFYNTSYKRYSVWGFVFNREGQLLLHQRSSTATDGRGLWDKSVGGHVDLRDSSTYITAQRELVEELFLPEAEYSKYIRADLGDIINFGDWSPMKRPERTFREAFAALGKADWVMFRATNADGDPLSIDRVSDRRINLSDNEVVQRRTVFISDVYFFVAPPRLLDNETQMKQLLGVAEERGAATDHRLVTVSQLRDWIDSAERDGTFRQVFTDDLVYININHRDLLERFAEFVRYIGNR